MAAFATSPVGSQPPAAPDADAAGSAGHGGPGQVQSAIPGLDALRAQIDEVDSRLLELLNRRASISLSIGRLKAGTPGAKIYDPAREARLLESLARRNQGPLTCGHVESIWREIMSASRALQKPCAVAYLGPEGTFSHFAAMDFLGRSMNFMPCAGFEEIFSKIASGECDLGAIPLENSIYGTIPQNFDLFAQYDVRIMAEFFSRIANSLLSREASLDSVGTVYSHAQPLGQCAGWLRANLPHARLISVASTATAARQAAEGDGAASIGHPALAPQLGMRVLASHIEDNKDNWTRFVLVCAAGSESRAPAIRQETGKANKTSLLFKVQDRAGALSSVLNIITSHGVNMTKLESRPLKGSAWKYVFFADLECDLLDPSRAPLLQELEAQCASLRVLGCYPEGPQLDSTLSNAGA